MRIRNALQKDSEELIRLIQLADNRTYEVASRKVKKILKSDEGTFILAFEKNKIIGYLLFMKTEEDSNASKFLDVENYSCVCWIATDPNIRTKGLGTKLLIEAEKFAKKNKKKGIWLDCRENVVGFYEKNGYENVGIYQKKTSSGLLNPCYVMVKKF